jgi:hypothetical protein
MVTYVQNRLLRLVHVVSLSSLSREWNKWKNRLLLLRCRCTLRVLLVWEDGLRHRQRNMLSLRTLITQQPVRTMNRAVARSQRNRLMKGNLAALLALTLCMLARHVLHYRGFAMVAVLLWFALRFWVVWMRLLAA